MTSGRHAYGHILRRQRSHHPPSLFPLLLFYDRAEVAKAEASEARAEEAETLKAKAEELAASLDQEVCISG